MKPASRFRYWLYRLQVRWSLTQAETRAITALLGLLLMGLTVSHLRGRVLPFDADTYAHLDAPFAAAAAASRADTVAWVEEDPFPIPINTAGAVELERLPRIGPAMAGRIIAYREQFGPFIAVEDLLQVSGIGPKTLEQLRPLIRLDSGAIPPPQVDSLLVPSSPSSTP